MAGKLLSIGAGVTRVADRFFCSDPPADGRVTLLDDEARHLIKVRRLGIGGVVEVFDGKGGAWSARVVAIARDRADLEVVGGRLPDRLAARRVTLATAVPKGERFDWLIEKATEIGVARLVPLATARSVVDPRNAKLDRQRRRIIEASKQCGRNTLMKLEKPTAWVDFIQESAETARYLAHPGGDSGALPKLPYGDQLTLAVGPEGGFTETEVAHARESGWQLISLGKTLLRIETACVVGCSILLASCEGRAE